MSENAPILLVEELSAKKKILGITVKRRRIPLTGNNMHVYVACQQVDGTRQMRRLLEGDSLASVSSVDSVLLYYVGLEQYRFSPVYAKIHNDELGHDWDCHFDGRISVSDSQLFLTSFAANIASPNAPLTPGLAESWLANRIASHVHDAVQEQTISDLREGHALPVTWWEKQLNGWLCDFGITVQVDDVSWSSAQAEAAEADMARKRDIERVMEAKKREHDAAIRETEARAEYEKRKCEIQADLKLSESERLHQIQILEKKHRKELIEADAEVEAARRDAEKATMEHEVVLARMRRDAETVKQVEELDRMANKRYEELVQGYNELQKTLEKIADIPGNLLAQLSSLDTQYAYAAAERLVSPEYSISASQLAGLGFQVDRQSLIEGLRDRSLADPDGVTIQKNDFISRDVGTARVKGLPVNTPLRFEFRTNRSGYVTLLNIGTSGSVYIHIPNLFVSSEQAKARKGHTYTVPGSALMPGERMDQLGLEYVEVGPPGWEHLAVLVSDEPLIDDSIAARANTEIPFVKLRKQELSDLFYAIMDAPNTAWSTGILSFLVG